MVSRCRPPESMGSAPSVQSGAALHDIPLLAWMTGFTAFNAFVAAAISAANLPFDELAADPTGVVFLALALPAHFLLFGGLLALPPLLLGWLTRRPRTATTMAVIVQTAWICIVLANTKVFELYRFHLNGMVANMVFGGALQDQVAFSGRVWAQVALIVTSVATLEVVSARGWWRWLERPTFNEHPELRRVLRTWCGGALLMLVSQGMVAYHDARGDRTVVSLVPYVP